MNLRIVTAPTAEPVTLVQAKVHLRLAADGDPETEGPDDSKIFDLIVAAREQAESFTGRAFTDAVYELRFGAFETRAPYWMGADGHVPIWAPNWENPWWSGHPQACGLALPVAPVQSVVSIGYVDPDGTPQVLGEDVYVLDDDPDHPAIRLAYDQQWPAIRYQPNAVRVVFQGGYEAPTVEVPKPANPVPRAAVQAMLLMIGEWYENRENSIVERGAQFELPFGAMALLRPLRRIMGV